MDSGTSGQRNDDVLTERSKSDPPHGTRIAGPGDIHDLLSTLASRGHGRNRSKTRGQR